MRSKSKIITNFVLFILIIIMIYYRDFSKYKIIENGLERIINGNIFTLNMEKIYKEKNQPYMKNLSVERYFDGRIVIKYSNRNIIAAYKNKFIDSDGEITDKFPIKKKLIEVSGDNIINFSEISKIQKEVNSIEYKNGLWIVHMNETIIKTYDLSRVNDMPNIYLKALEIDLRHDGITLIKVNDKDIDRFNKIIK